MLTVSGRTPEALQDSVRLYREFLGGAGRDIPLYDICHAAALRRTHHEERVALTAATNEQLRRLMDQFLEGGRGTGIARGRACSESALNCICLFRTGLAMAPHGCFPL